MRIGIDRERCQGAGMCALTAPQVFDQDPGDGRAVLLTARVPAGQLPAARLAAGLCPAAALSLLDDSDAGETDRADAAQRAHEQAGAPTGDGSAPA
ncbi:ferredoxin [Streptomyces sp. NPDC058685]|uniref:ferredoxin n=1 Tax=Streptomyces sp. NPDC058685 TaxID=3346598 RepID=UPI0036476877